MNIKAIYPGTFDPITNGHIDIIKRAAKIFSEVIVGVAESKLKQPYFDCAQRIELAREALQSLDNVNVLGFNALLVDFARQQEATVLLRGLRAASDFEYEFQLAGMNRKLDSKIETVFLTPGENHLFISSSLVREIAQLKGDVSAFVPPEVARAFKEKK